MSDETRLYGLIGYPVKHSLSGFMHNAAFKALDINARYELFEIEPQNLDVFFAQTIREKKICGFNVTIPHKERVLNYINTSLPREVEIIQAANTIKVEAEGKSITCLNTDGAGFLRHIQELKFALNKKTVAILGAGGAAKAVSVFIAKEQPKKMSIFDVDKKKAEDLVSKIKTYFAGIDVCLAKTSQDLDIKNADLLVNATPVGMKEDDPCLVDKDSLHRGLLVYDLIYNPARTKLLKWAEEKGANVSNGLKMLLYQGALAFKYWTGINAPEEVMWQALTSHISLI